MTNLSDDDKISEKRRAIQKIEFLPTIPVMLQKILATSYDPHSSAQDLQETIIKDQSISAAILKLANSAYYGYPRSVDDISRAIVIIGFKTVVSVAICVSVFKSLSDKFNSQEFNVEEFWKHTFAAGEAAKILVQKVDQELSSHAYIIGLLHDIGKAVLSFLNSSNFDDAVFNARALNKPLYRCEEEIFGFDHQAAGGLLGDRWQLPENIVAGIKYHHNIEACPEHLQEDAITAHAANYLAKSAKFGSSGDERLWELHPLVKTKLNITSETVDEVKSELDKKREEINMFLESIE